VDGDDLTEPVTDTARGILDGHIVLSRSLANKNQYPAIDVLASISRLMNEIITPEHRKIANEIKRNMAIYRESEDLINIGAYVPGNNEKLDRAIKVIDSILDFIQQGVYEKFTYEEVIGKIKNVL